MAVAVANQPEQTWAKPFTRCGFVRQRQVLFFVPLFLKYTRAAEAMNKSKLPNHVAPLASPFSSPLLSDYCPNNVDGFADIHFAFADAYPAGGGNGIAWYVELNDSSETFASGTSERGGPPTGTRSLSKIEILAGQRLNFIVDANGDHACDWTQFVGSIVLL
jgi:hypothetical protein